MHMHSLHFKIDQLRKENLVTATSAIAFLILAFFVTVYLPTMLYQFVFATETLTEEPALVRFIPVVSFVVAIGFFLYALLSNLARMMKIRKLEKEAEMLNLDDECCGGHGHDHHDHMDMEFEEEVEEVKTPSKKKTTRK